MDAKWFKQQQRKAGVTADDIARIAGKSRTSVSHIYHGHTKMSLEWAKAFSEALQVPLATVLEKAGVAEPSEARTLAPGFSESDAAPFAVNAETREMSAVANALGRRGDVTIWQVRTNAMALAGYLPGDYLLVDPDHSELVKPGDLVIAHVYNRLGKLRAVLRRLLPPVLVPAAPPGSDDALYVVDGENVVVVGKVTASWRM